MKILLCFFAALGVFAQSSTPIACPSGTAVNCYMMEAQAVPTSTAVLTTSGMTFLGGWVACATSQTVTLTDGNSIIIGAAALSLASGQVYGLNLFAGSYFSKGLSIVASGSGCRYHMRWSQ